MQNFTEHLLGRAESLFSADLSRYENDISTIVKKSKFLILGGAGSIGQAVTKELFKRNPRVLHVVDLSENYLAELVRDVRSEFGYIDGDFQTFAIDIGAFEFEVMFKQSIGYDYIINLSALKHVRSERDPYTLMRMIDNNVFNVQRTIDLAIMHGTKQYFSVSTDKAANPTNLMGASKRVMELYMISKSNDIKVSTARFANVAFSNGSIMESFQNRLAKGQPIVAPKNIYRYFMTVKEAGQICILSTLFGKNRDILFPLENSNFRPIAITEIAKLFIKNRGLIPKICKSEEEARQMVKSMKADKFWPCYWTDADTSGEKYLEEFYTENEKPESSQFLSIGRIPNKYTDYSSLLEVFENELSKIRSNSIWSVNDVASLFSNTLREFNHNPTGKNLDQRL